MANYENKLSDWFKQVEKTVEEFRAKKREPEADRPKEEEALPTAQASPPVVQDAVVESLAREAPASVATMIDTRRILAEDIALDSESATGEARPVATETRPDPALFDDSDVPQVEDFFSFLGKTRSPGPMPVESGYEPEEFRVPEDQGTLVFSEGTGEPRPIIAEPTPAEPVAQPEPVVPQQSAPPEPTPVPKAQPQAPKAPQPSRDDRWDRLPRHLQTLFAGETREVAQRSYKTFKESRDQLIERLMDPVISLEEAARILNVCPTTVRRYTNRGVLKCLRTAGNQRRFRLSDVLGFMYPSATALGGETRVGDQQPPEELRLGE